MADRDYGHLSGPRPDRPRFIGVGRLIFGAALLTIGVLWTLDNLGIVDSDRVLRWWPAAVVAFGLAKLLGLGTQRSLMTGGFFTLIGLVILGAEADLYDLNIWRLWWPTLMMFVGGSILLRALRGPGAAAPGPDGTVPSEDSYIRTFAMMGGTKVRVTSNAFRGAEPSAFMAGIEYDLRGATPAGDTVVMDVFAMWGGIEIVVPPDWRVSAEVMPLMGGVEDNSTSPSGPARTTLVVRGTVVMGGVEIKTKAPAAASRDDA